MSVVHLDHTNHRLPAYRALQEDRESVRDDEGQDTVPLFQRGQRRSRYIHIDEHTPLRGVSASGASLCAARTKMTVLIFSCQQITQQSSSSSSSPPLPSPPNAGAVAAAAVEV